jgi:hypothetical protein
LTNGTKNSLSHHNGVEIATVVGLGVAQEADQPYVKVYICMVQKSHTSHIRGCFTHIWS